MNEPSGKGIPFREWDSGIGWKKVWEMGLIDTKVIWESKVHIEMFNIRLENLYKGLDK